MDTIFALSTAPGKAGVAIIRVSGSRVPDVLVDLCGDLPAPRVASVRTILDGSGDPIDEGLVLYFQKGESFTGEDVSEFHLHGSAAVISETLSTLGSIASLRIAEPGEFTRRALENGKLDLAQVEGLADLIDAETDAQRKQALRILSGDLGEQVEAWRADLIRAAALLEATIDFADEEVPEDVSPEVTALIEGIVDELKKEISGTEIAERIRTGFEVAIVGAPNVGKSTLLNALAGREAAITSEYAGTTRDIIEVRMDLGGLPVTLLDTAGLRETDDAVETIGVERARERADKADLRVFLVEPGEKSEMTAKPEDIVLVCKADLHPDLPNTVSGLTGQGISELVSVIKSILSKRAQHSGVAIRFRHKQAMERGLVYLNSALSLAQDGEQMTDVAAEELRSAIRALDSLVGRIDIETVLDEIFASFCLGK